LLAGRRGRRRRHVVVSSDRDCAIFYETVRDSHNKNNSTFLMIEKSVFQPIELKQKSPKPRRTARGVLGRPWVLEVRPGGSRGAFHRGGLQQLWEKEDSKSQ
jgi:hypothetical protein